jgi:hypothetical protein
MITTTLNITYKFHVKAGLQHSIEVLIMSSLNLKPKGTDMESSNDIDNWKCYVYSITSMQIMTNNSPPSQLIIQYYIEKCNIILFKKN